MNTSKNNHSLNRKSMQLPKPHIHLNIKPDFKEFNNHFYQSTSQIVLENDPKYIEIERSQEIGTGDNSPNSK